MDGIEMSKLHPGHARDQVSCPGCGREYGAYGRKVCRVCQECSKCCTCPPEEQDLITGNKMVEELNQ